MKRYVFAVVAILLALTLSACACEHEWKDATCIDPQICSLCGETQGEPVGHKWKNSTCVDPQVCSACNATQGEPAGHKWKDATCVDPQICSVCEETQGDSLGHTAGELEYQETDYVNASKVYVTKCTVCGEDIETTEESLETLHNGEIFEISPYDFYKRLKNVYAEVDDDMDIRNGTNGDQFVCGFLRDSKQKGFIQFSNEAGNITTSQKYDACFDGMMGIISEDICDVLTALIMTCDPTLTETDALATALSLCAIGEKTVNGIIYQCQVGGDDGGMVWIDIKK